MADERRLVIWRGRDDNGSRLLEAVLKPDGGLVIEGQDLGAAVKVFGPDYSEYEFDWTADAGEVPRIIEVLGGRPGDDPLELLHRWTHVNRGRDPGQFLYDAGVTLGFWSRIGD